ncbi:hypothetical protein [Siminovitchia fortis]|uniref:hypothetical protein n=1 Tax=Siminovitchia fortis TaxID=254758 RepID=UPI001643E1AE|nr:hypothetical protein [Siminovitchia fortis]
MFHDRVIYKSEKCKKDARETKQMDFFTGEEYPFCERSIYMAKHSGGKAGKAGKILKKHQDDRH